MVTLRRLNSMISRQQRPWTSTDTLSTSARNKSQPSMRVTAYGQRVARVSHAADALLPRARIVELGVDGISTCTVQTVGGETSGGGSFYSV